jgi:hypothetical protein
MPRGLQAPVELPGNFLVAGNTERPEVRQPAFSAPFDDRYDMVRVPEIAGLPADRNSVFLEPLSFEIEARGIIFDDLQVKAKFFSQRDRIEPAERANPFVALLKRKTNVGRAGFAAPFLGTSWRTIERPALRQRPAAVVTDLLAVGSQRALARVNAEGASGRAAHAQPPIPGTTAEQQSGVCRRVAKKERRKGLDTKETSNL